jgi:AcrR family transcriptional regulator
MSSTAVTPGRRDRKREATRKALEEAAWALFQERGFAQTTIEDITERVDVAARTFFRHFPSKEAVLFGDPRALEEPFRRALLGRPAGEDVYTALRHSLHALAVVVGSQRDRHLLRHRLLQEHAGRRIEDRFAAITEKSTMLRDVIAERLATTADDPRPQLLAGVALTMMDVTYGQWIAGGATTDLGEMLDATVATFAQVTTAPTPPRTGRNPRRTK